MQESNKRQSIIELSDNAISNIDFIDPLWDPALIGYACKGGDKDYLIPVYGYQAMKAVLLEKSITPQQMYSLLYRTITGVKCEGKKPLLFSRYSGNSLWWKIQEDNYPRWEYLDKAIVGLGSIIGGNESGICYSKQLCIEILQNTSSSLSSNHWENYLANSYKLDNTIINVSLGDHSPFFITHIK